MFVRSFVLSGVIISSCWLWWGSAVLNQNAPFVTVDMNGASQGVLRHFWRSTGLSPPNRSDAAEFLLSQDERLNLALIGALPNRAITQVRVHWLLDLISVSDVGRNGSVVYDFTLLDQFLDHLLASGLSPGFELMGNPSDFLSDFSSDDTTLLWQDLVMQVAERYIGRYGLKHVSKWWFELWNEPDLKMYNIFNFTLKSYLRYARASRDGLNAAFATGSNGVDPILHLAGPAGIFKDRTRHPLCWGLLEYCAREGRSACPLDLITFHKKGAGSGDTVLRNGLRLVKDIHRLYPSLQEVPVANDEADPLTGWWRDEVWRADVRYAAMVARGVTRHHQLLIRQEDINLQLLSNDNAFLNYYPYYFTQRTMMARFQYNETNPPHIQMFVKPVYTVMALLAYLGDTEMAVNIEYPDPRILARDLCGLLRGRLQRTMTSGIPVHIQVTAALRFFAEGGYQRGVGQDSFVALSQPSTGRCIHNVCNAVSDLLADRWIVFPTTAAQRERVQQGFLPILGFPGVIGAIDCTHIAITTPHEHEEAYYNHHEFHSINVQVICDQDLRALNVNARFPGRVHDQFIWRDSAVKVEMKRLHQERIGDFYLLGDSGYAPEPWMLTPITHAVEGTPEARYTQTHCSARNVIERFFGVLKGRFRCLLRDRTLHYEHAQAARIIETCVVLHNMMIHYRIPFDEETMVAEPHVPAANEDNIANDANVGREVRADIVRRYFYR